MPLPLWHPNSTLPGVNCKPDLPSVCASSLGASRIPGAFQCPPSSRSWGQQLGFALSDDDPPIALPPHSCTRFLKERPAFASPMKLPRLRRPQKGRALQRGRSMDSRGHTWRGRKGKRWLQRSFSTWSMDSDQNPLGDEGFWDQAEGKKKLNEIEDMKELISEATKLQSGRGNSQANESSQLSSEEQEEKMREEQAQKLREELARKAKEQAERRKQAEQMFQLGQRAYGRGMYDKAVEFLEAALTKIPAVSNLGGEVQIWLAMAYEANNKHIECIALYKALEKTHPSRAVRKQAKDLRYILEAPKLKISKEEMVSIPLIGDGYSDVRTWSKMYRERKRKTWKKVQPSRDYMEDWLVWKPPRWERSPYFWVAVTIWLTLVGIALVFQE